MVTPCLPISVDLLSPLDNDTTSLNNNFLHSPTTTIDEHSPVHPIPSPTVDCRSVPHPLVQDVGCQVSLSAPTPVTVYKEAKKLSLPVFDPAKMSWNSFAMKLHASLIKCDMAYLFHEASTNSMNDARTFSETSRYCSESIY